MSGDGPGQAGDSRYASGPPQQPATESSGAAKRGKATRREDPLTTPVTGPWAGVVKGVRAPLAPPRLAATFRDGRKVKRDRT